MFPGCSTMTIHAAQMKHFGLSTYSPFLATLKIVTTCYIPSSLPRLPAAKEVRVLFSKCRQTMGEPLVRTAFKYLTEGMEDLSLLYGSVSGIPLGRLIPEVWRAERKSKMHITEGIKRRQSPAAAEQPWGGRTGIVAHTCGIFSAAFVLWCCSQRRSRKGKEVRNRCALQTVGLTCTGLTDELPI